MADQHGNVRKGANAAARIYLSENRKRDITLKQCIAIAAKENGVTWESIAAYLTGVGARKLYFEDQYASQLEALRLCYSALSRMLTADIDWSGIVYGDSPLPDGAVSHSAMWELEDAFTQMKETGIFDDVEEGK